MVIVKNLKVILFLIIMNNFGDSQQQCQSYTTSSLEQMYPSDQIYLLESTDEGHSEINNQFLETNGHLTRLRTLCQLKVEDIIEYTKRFPYLINLYVTDFYQNNYNKVAESLVYAGDIDNSSIRVDVCEVREDENRTCDPFIEERKKYVKLSTKMLEEKSKEIFKRVLEFQPNKWMLIEKPLNVINCNENEIPSNDYNGFEIINQYCSDENLSFLNSVSYNTLAILAPKVFDFNRPIDNPVVFYEDSYITKETKDLFRNSMTAVPWQSLKYGFLFVIKKMGWKRVAIISDSSEYSQEFEKELTTLFRKNGIAYMAETCVTSNCAKVINKIDESSAKIILANFDPKNVEKIAQYAKSKRLIRARNIIWMTRNLPVKEAEKMSLMLESEIFNLSFMRNLTYILEILNRTVADFNTINVNCDTEPCTFSENKTAAHLKNSLKTSRIKIVSVKNTAENAENIIGSILIDEDNISEEKFNYNHKIQDTFIQCTIWNDRFEKPCNDTELVLLMMISTIFFLTILGVMLFFQAPELFVPYKRMC